MMTDHERALARRAAERLRPPDPVLTTRYHDGKRKLPRHVYPHGSRFRAQLTRGGKNHTLGTFDTPGQAEEAVAKWKKENPAA